MSKDPNIFLAHARDCCQKITAYVQADEQLFLTDTKTQDAVLRNLEIIGQCVKDANLSELEANHPDISWREIAAFRNILAHAYMGIELSIVWRVIEHAVPKLQTRLNQILTNWTP